MRLFGRHRPEEAPAVKEAQEKRDELFDDFESAMREVDRVQHRVLDDYRRAEKRRALGRA